MSHSQKYEPTPESFWYEGATMTGQAGRPGFLWYIEKPITAAMALRAACSGVVGAGSHTPGVIVVMERAAQ